MINFLIVLTFIFLCISIFQDLKRREIDNWSNLILLFSGIAFVVFSFSIDRIFSLILLLIFSAIFSNLLFYSRVFAYGDTKLLFAMTPLFVTPVFLESLKNYLFFAAILALATVIWGLSSISFLALKNWKVISKDFFKNFSFEVKIVFVLGIIFFILSYFEIIFLFPSLMFILFSFLFSVSKVLETKVLTRYVPIAKISEGEWLAEDIRIGKKVFSYSWEGLTEDDIKFLRKHKKKIKVKQGIPFAPGFLIAFFIYIFRDFLWGLLF